MFLSKKQHGFSLVELMIVVGIIGILATLAVPRFRTFQAKAKQSEVKTTLNQVMTLQESYHMDNNTYSAMGAYGCSNCTATTSTTTGTCTRPADVTALGFDLPNCDKTRYVYSTAAAVGGSASGGDYMVAGESGSGAAHTIMPGCATSDLWRASPASGVSNTSNAVTDAGCN